MSAPDEEGREGLEASRGREGSSPAEALRTFGDECKKNEGMDLKKTPICFSVGPLMSDEAETEADCEALTA